MREAVEWLLVVLILGLFLFPDEVGKNMARW